MNQRTAADLPFRHHDLNAEARQQADGGCVDFGIEHRLGTARQDRHATVALGLRYMQPRLCKRRRRGNAAGREIEHGGESL